MGHDFRPDYLLIGRFIDKIRKNRKTGQIIPVIALTATATKEVRLDIEKHCSLRKDYCSVNGSTFRKNLFYDVKIVHSVEHRTNLRNEMINFILKKFDDL